MLPKQPFLFHFHFPVIVRLALSADTAPTCPMTRTQVIDAYFMEHRARLIDIAAFLDRLDRAAPDADAPNGAAGDFREAAFRQALQILSDGDPQRAARVLDLLSDHTTELPQSADGMKGASGAPPAAVDGGAA